MFPRMQKFCVIMMLCLSGCSVFSPIKTEPVNAYIVSRLPAPYVRPGHAGAILVNYPQASAVYNTTQMAYSTQPFKISYFAKNQWAETPSQMLQPLLAQTLQNTKHFRQVVQPGMLGQYQFILNTQLLQFEQVFEGYSSVMRIHLKAQIVNASNGAVVSTKEFTKVEPAMPSPYGGVVAANRAVAETLADVAKFAVKSI